MSKKSYSEDFKKSSVQKLLSPGNHGLSVTARKIGVTPTSLSNWKKKYGNQLDMKKSKNKSINDWTPEQKLEAIAKTYSMSEDECGEYLRANGLYSTDLESFKQDALSGFKSTKGRPKLTPEVVALRKEKKQLARDLKRNQKALAEQSARIILLKKSHEIWGEPEDDE